MVALYEVVPGGIAQAEDLNQLRRLWRGGSVHDVKNGYGATGDGVTDDTTVIQAVLTAAAAGSTVRFPPGVYMTTGLTISTRIILDLAAATLKLLPSAVLTSPAVTVSASGTRWYGGSVDGNRANQSASRAGVRLSGSDLVLDGVTIANTSSYGVHSAVGNNIEVCNCNLSVMGADGIFIQQSGVARDNFRILNNTIDLSAETNPECIKIHGSSSYNITNAIIENNRCKNASAAIGIETWGGVRYATIEGNHIHGGGMGVSIDLTHWSSVKGNKITGSVGTGIEVAAGTNNVIDDNTVVDATNGVVLVNTTPTDNTISNNRLNVSSRGVKLNPGADSTVISGNRITCSAGYAIELQRSVDCSITGNVADGLGTAQKAIMLDRSESLAITGNTLRNFTQSGVLVYSANASDVLDNIVVTGNVITDTNVPFATQLSNGAAIGPSVMVFGNPGYGSHFLDFLNGVEVAEA